jgi:hypothetical protein
MTEPVTPETRKLTYNDRLIFYHPTQAGTGAAVRLAFRLRRPEEERDSCFFLEMARQKTAPSRNEEGGRTAATFDWQNRATVKIDFMDAGELLTVLEGRAESVKGGKGLFHDAGDMTTVIGFRKNADPPGYSLDISRKVKADGKEGFKGHILLNEAECIGMRCMLQQGLGLLGIANLVSRLLYPVSAI